MAFCPSCGTALTDGARFCASCGAPSSSASSDAAPGAAKGRESRRTVSILFADVVGSTELAESLDAEAVRRHMRDWFTTARQAIERHGGMVEKFIGDAVMAVFGVPTIREDDALRAVRAAADLRDADHGPLSIRIGVTTGEVVAGDPGTGATFVTGDAVNTAARLQSAAAPGTIVIDEATWRRVRDGASAAPLAPLELKGKREPVSAYRLETIDPEGPAIARRLEGPMVGRSRELAQLREALVAAQGVSTAQVVTVVGQPGIGKSRLVHEFLREARRSATVIRGRCLPYGEGITYRPIAELIREAAGVARTDDPAAAARRIEALVDDLDQAPLISSQLLALAAFGHEVEAPAEAAWAMRRMLEHLGATRPVVAVVDDIQWASPAAMDLLAHVVERARTSSILLVCMARPEVSEVHATWPPDRPTASTIKLTPLTTEEGALLVDELLGGLPLGRGARERITLASDGNPLFIEQLLAMLQDRGILARVKGAWVVRGNLEQVEIPPSIAALLAARIDRLAVVEREVLERASVAGKAFSVDLIAGLAPGGDQATTASALEALVRSEFLVPDAGPMAAERGFRFRHLLVLDAAYAGIAKADRARLHERLADRLEADGGALGPEEQLIVGHHLEQAYLYRTALGDAGGDVVALARRAVAYIAPAGESAFDRGDIRAAVPLLRRSVAIAHPDDIWRGRSLYVLARALRYAGEQAEAWQTMERADAALRDCPDAGLAYRIRLSQTVTAVDRGEREASVLLALAREAYDDAERRGDGSDMLNALTYIGGATLELEGIVAEEPIHLQAVALARELGLDRRADRALGIIANRLPNGPTPVPSALERLNEMLGDIREDVMAAALIHLSIGACLAMLDQTEAARDSLATAHRIADEVGEVLPLLAADWPSFVCFVERTCGEPERAEAIARWSCAELDRLDDPYHLAAMLLELATVLMAQGRLEEVPGLIDRSRAITSPTDQVAQLYLSLAQAELLLQRQRHGEAVPLAREAAGSLARFTEVTGHIEATILLARALRGAGDEEAAQAAAHDARRLAEAKGHRAALRRIDAFLAAESM